MPDQYLTLWFSINVIGVCPGQITESLSKFSLTVISYSTDTSPNFSHAHLILHALQDFAILKVWNRENPSVHDGLITLLL